MEEAHQATETERVLREKVEDKLKRVLEEQNKLNRMLDSCNSQLEQFQERAKQSHKKIVEAENLIESLERNLRVAESLLREKDEQVNDLSEALVISKVEYKALLEKVDDDPSNQQPRRISIFLEGNKPLQNVTVGTQDTSTFLAGMEVETLGVVKMLNGDPEHDYKSQHKDRSSEDSNIRVADQVTISHFHKFEVNRTRLYADKAIETLDLSLKKMRRNSNQGGNVELGQVIQYIEMSKDASDIAGTGVSKQGWSQGVLSDAAKRVMRKLGSRTSQDHSLDSINSFQDQEEPSKPTAPQKDAAQEQQVQEAPSKTSQIFSSVNLKSTQLKRSDSEEWTEVKASTMVGHSSSTTNLPEIGKLREEKSITAEANPKFTEDSQQVPQKAVPKMMDRYPTFAANDISSSSNDSHPAKSVSQSEAPLDKISTVRPVITKLSFAKHQKPILEVSASGDSTSVKSVSLTYFTPEVLSPSVDSPFVSPQNSKIIHKGPSKGVNRGPQVPESARDYQPAMRNAEFARVGGGSPLTTSAVREVPDWQRATATFGPRKPYAKSPPILRMESIPVGEAEVAAFSRALLKFTSSSKSRSPPRGVRTGSREKMISIKTGSMSERSRDGSKPAQKNLRQFDNASVRSGVAHSPSIKSIARSQGWSFSALAADNQPSERSGCNTFRSDFVNEDSMPQDRTNNPFKPNSKVARDDGTFGNNSTKQRQTESKIPVLPGQARGTSKSPTIRPRVSTNSDLQPLSALEMRKYSHQELH